jgi:glycosyltransferase involved in cell wall biosynthesis
VRIGWQGGASHYEDWCVLTEVLPFIMNKYKNVTLVIMGQAFEGVLKRLPQERVERHGWIETPAHPYRSAILDIDISLIPLVENEFNQCKSNIKWVEAGALSVPSVTSHVSPYKEFAEEFNGIFVGNNTKSWTEAISLLIEDRVLRAKMAAGARETVERLFNIHDHYSLWLDVYTELLEKRKAA